MPVHMEADSSIPPIIAPSKFDPRASLEKPCFYKILYEDYSREKDWKAENQRGRQNSGPEGRKQYFIERNQETSQQRQE